MSELKVTKISDLAGVAKGMILQVVNFQTGAVATGTTVIPLDNTIPQITEGTEFMSLSITPKSATNKLRITTVVNCGGSTTLQLIVALFQDSGVNAIATSITTVNAVAHMCCITFVHYMTAGTTSSTTFRIRGGPQTAATFSFNGSNGVQVFGGVAASSITIEEIQV